MVIGGGKKAPMKKSKSLSIDKVWVPKNPKVYQLINFLCFRQRKFIN